MKKFILLATAVAIFSMVGGLAFAESKDAMSTKEGYGSAGCGLGSFVFGNTPGIVQIFAATTNGTFGSQTFGITPGTSNCEKQAKFASNERLNEFVKANMDNLAKNIALGNGETLDTLAELLGISDENKKIVYEKLQSNFSNIFTSEKVEIADVIDNIIAIING